jgi:hypothetical protein
MLGAVALLGMCGALSGCGGAEPVSPPPPISTTPPPVSSEALEKSATPVPNEGMSSSSGKDSTLNP